ncbi:MAG: hypothetical protein EPO39_08910 [Candidatus Manganitrophaceae bacterium]|nr:MAG: hypothetical protein EPO39_08910 [Candidatus Manganitrophaceae bacterium]
MDFVPSYEFQKYVQQYNGNYGGPDFEELDFLEENFAQIVLGIHFLYPIWREIFKRRFRGNTLKGRQARLVKTFIQPIDIDPIEKHKLGSKTP